MIIERGSTTWLLVADGAGGHLYEVHPTPLRIEPIAGVISHATKPPHHTIEGRSEARDRVRQVRAGEIAHDLRAAIQKFDRLIVVAPSHTIGDLRAAFADELRRKVAMEIHGEWTHFELADIAVRLKGHLQPLTSD